MTGSAHFNEAIPLEYRPTAEALVPEAGFPDASGPKESQALAFAEMLGIGWDYRRLLSAPAEEMDSFLDSFRNNIDILIQKTWVEKDDEQKKICLQDKVPTLLKLLDKEDYRSALSEFGAILDGLAFLLFGAQSRQCDFTEYTMRIDEQMGLFWWYGSRLADLSKIEDDSAFFPVLLIGLVYLTNF
jgi:hypothetical protein